MYWYLIVLLLFIIGAFLFKRNRGLKFDNSERGILTDSDHYYTIGLDTISKVTPAGKIKAAKKFKHAIFGAKEIDGKLIVHTNKAILWLDHNLNVINVMELPFIKGHLAWIDKNKGLWWVCDAKKDSYKSKIYCFNDDWVPEGFWRLFLKDNIIGGKFIDDTLHIVGDKQMYTIDLPEDSVPAQVINELPIAITGGTFSVENDSISCLQGKKLIKIPL